MILESFSREHISTHGQSPPQLQSAFGGIRTCNFKSKITEYFRFLFFISAVDLISVARTGGVVVELIIKIIAIVCLGYYG